MGILSKIIKGSAEDAVKQVGEVIDSISTNDEEKAAKKNELTAIITKALTDSAALQKDVLLGELNGNGLQRNWRPLLMLAFGFILIYQYFLAPLFHLQAIPLPERFFDLLELGLGGYVIGRSVEKVASTVTRNVDISFQKKKDRNVTENK